MKKFNLKTGLENFIFSSRWILIPFYVGLFVVMLLYTFVYVKEIARMVSEVGILNKEAMLLSALEMVDVVMVANLIKMIITGSYNSFVTKSHSFDGEKASSGMLKVKMSTSIAGVSSIHLLQAFINSANTPWDQIHKQVYIHATFLVGALMLAVIDYLHCKSEVFEARTEMMEEKIHRNNRANEKE